MKYNKKNIYLYCIIILLLSMTVLLKSCNTNNEIKEAKFINDKPSIILNEIEYTITKEILEESQLEKKPIAKITDIDLIVSYTEEENPYKNPNRIYKIKDTDIESKVALEVNNKIYLATANRL